MQNEIKILPRIIKKQAKTKQDAKNKIYAFGTQVSVGKSINEIKKIIKKFDAIGFQNTEHPSGAKYIRFAINDKQFGIVPIQIDIPLIYLTTKTGIKNQFLERESWRLAVLELKTRIYMLDNIEPRPLFLLVDKILTKNNITISQLLLQKGGIEGLLPAMEEG